MAAVWIGMIAPVLLVMIRHIKVDVLWHRQARSNLLFHIKQWKSGSSERLRELRLWEFLLQDYSRDLRGRAEKYIVVSLCAAVGLMIALHVGTHRIINQEAIEAGQFALWLFLLPAVAMIVGVVTFAYAQTIREVNRELQDIGLGDEIEVDLIDSVIKLRDTLDGSRSPYSFLVALFKSPDVSVFFLIVFAVYFKKTLRYADWVSVFVPESIRDLVSKVFG
jgi:hypothetical protein